MHYGANYQTPDAEYGWTARLEDMRRSVAWELETLGTDYIDFAFIHCIDEASDLDAFVRSGAFDHLRSLRNQGVVRHLGLSTHSPELAGRVLDLGEVDLMMFSVNPVYDYGEGEALGVAHMAWAPFAEGANGFFQNPLLAQIGAAYGKSVGQVALRYLLDLGVIVIPKTTHTERMAENIDVFDFDLTDAEKDQIAGLDVDRSLCYDHRDVQLIGGLLRMVKDQIEAQRV